MNGKQRKELVSSTVTAAAEKLAAEEDVRIAVYSWDLTISELTLLFEETLRRYIPVPRKAIAIGPVRQVREKHPRQRSHAL